MKPKMNEGYFNDRLEDALQQAKETLGSPKLGSILEILNENIGRVMYSNEDPVKTNVVQNSPEFWEEVVEEDYEILKLKAGEALFERISFGRWQKVGGEKEVYRKLEVGKPYATIPLEIYSVKRLSDGEVFTVGDKIYYKFWSFNKTLGSIFIENNILKFKMEEGFRLTLKEMSHVKKLLFTTKDGVDIFEGDKIWGINECTWIPFYVSANERKIKEKWRYGKFSTKESAEKYILMNKPCLSINDIIHFKGSKDSTFMKVYLKDLVKSKM